jgi:Uma2 family endonuclease
MTIERAEIRSPATLNKDRGAGLQILTVEEFLDSCPSDQRHYQLFGGVIVAMAPPGGRHQRIAGVPGLLP